jgi:2'-5' RNA ligase
MSIRTFIAVDIGSLEPLVNLEQALRDTGADLKLVEPENIHITLKFLGPTPEDNIDEIIEIMNECSSSVSSFNLVLKGAGAFPNLSYLKVLWVGLENYEPLVPIAKCLDASLTRLGFKAEKRGFKPHITLARVKTRKKKNAIKDLLLKNETMEFAEVHVDSIKLKKSVLDSIGPTYYNIGEVNLKE